VRRVLFSRVEHVDRVEILCRLLDLIHQSYTVYLLQKGLTLLLNGIFRQFRLKSFCQQAINHLPLLGFSRCRIPNLGRICKMQLYDYAQVCHRLHPNLSIAFFSSPPLPIYPLYTATHLSTLYTFLHVLHGKKFFVYLVYFVVKPLLQFPKRESRTTETAEG